MHQVPLVRVMVHPFYSVYDHTPKVISNRYAVVLRRNVAYFPQDNEHVRKHLQMFEAMYRFYKREIDRVKKRPGAVLLFVKGTGSVPVEDVRRFEAKGIPTGVANALVDQGILYQMRLEKYARKLGKRLIVRKAREKHELLSIAEPFEAELAKRKLVVSSATPVEVFGEYRYECVKHVHSSFESRGFNAKVVESKATDSW